MNIAISIHEGAEQASQIAIVVIDHAVRLGVAVHRHEQREIHSVLLSDGLDAAHQHHRLVQLELGESRVPVEVGRSHYASLPSYSSFLAMHLLRLFRNTAISPTLCRRNELPWGSLEQLTSCGWNAFSFAFSASSSSNTRLKTWFS